MFASEKDYKDRIKKIDKDPRIIKLFSKVTDIVPEEKIEDLGCDTL